MKKLLIILIFVLLVQVQGWCATLYLRSTGGNWSDNATWSTTSNGSADTTAPTSSDDVICDPNSGSATLTVNTASLACNNLNFTGFTGTLAINQIFLVYGDITLSNTMTINNSSIDSYGLGLSKTGTQTFTSNGKVFPGYIYTNANSTLSLSDNFNSSSSILSISAGNLITNNNTVTCGLFRHLNGTSTITLGSSTVNCTSLDFSGTGLTLTANTATINCVGNFLGWGGNLWRNCKCYMFYKC